MNSGRTDLLEVERFVVGHISTNCYVAYGSVTRDGLLIDPGGTDPAIKEFISSRGINIRYTLNTHGHYDHIMADRDFGYPVLIHGLDRECLSDPRKSLSILAGGRQGVVDDVITISGGQDITVGSLVFRVIHTPGHTPGGVSVLCGNTLFSGDTLFFEGVGRTDLPGGDFQALTGSIKEKLFALPDATKVLPGHGPETTIGHERRFNPFV